MSRKALTKLRNDLIPLASSKTAYDKVRYEERRAFSPLAQHCGPVSFIVQYLFGGELVGGTVQGERHIWNRLPSGEEVDLTSDQFGGDGYTPLTTGKILPSRRTINARNRALLDLYKSTKEDTN